MGFKFRSDWRWLTIVLLWVGAICGRAAAAERVQVPEVQIQLYDSAHVPAATLDRAGREVVRIFHAAGVGAVWINCSAHLAADKDACRVSSARKQFVVHIIPKGKTSKDSVYGEAFIGEDGKGKYADRLLRSHPGHAYPMRYRHVAVAGSRGRARTGTSTTRSARSFVVGPYDPGLAKRYPDPREHGRSALQPAGSPQSATSDSGVRYEAGKSQG